MGRPGGPLKTAEIAMREVRAAAEGKKPGDVGPYTAGECTLEFASKQLAAAFRHHVSVEVREREVADVREAVGHGDLADGSLEAAWRESHELQKVQLGPRLAALAVFMAPFMVEIVRFRARTGKYPDALLVTPQLARALRMWEATRLTNTRMMLGLPWIERGVVPVPASLSHLAFYSGDFAVVFARDAPEGRTASPGLVAPEVAPLTRAVRGSRRKRRTGMGAFTSEAGLKPGAPVTAEDDD